MVKDFPLEHGREPRSLIHHSRKVETMVFHTKKQNIAIKWYALAMLAHLKNLGLIMVNAFEQAASNRATAAQPRALAPDQPLYRAYRSVAIGMTADETRQKLGAAVQTSAEMDVYEFSATEMAQVYYDESNRVKALSVSYVGGADAPPATAIVGQVEANSEGVNYRLLRYPRAGCWVSYNRTAGDPPIVTITIQKIGH
jgi:hypothetical protein